jgi:hypothetical protein
MPPLVNLGADGQRLRTAWMLRYDNPWRPDRLTWRWRMGWEGFVILKQN